MKNFFTLIALLFAGFAAHSQYYYYSNPGEFTGSLNQDVAYPLGGGQVTGWTSIVGPSATTPIWSANQTLPFPFNFNGSPVTDYKISSTGVLTFTTSAVTVPSATPAALPDASIPDKSICMWGLNASGTNDNGSIKVFGTAPNRQLWIHYSSCVNGTIGWSYYSIVLVEGTDQIFVVDQRNTSGVGALSIGVQIDATTASSVTGSPTVGAMSGTDFNSDDDFHYEFIQGVQPTNEIKLVSSDLLSYVAAGNVTIEGTVKNLGSSPITSFDATWNTGSGAQTATITGVNIASDNSYQFSHTTPMVAVAGTNYTVDLDVSLIGDVDMTNNSAQSSTVTLTQVPARTVVGEERTGTWCGWCPRGAVALAGMESDPSFIGIAVHNGDAMEIPAYDTDIATWIPSSFPQGGVDRVTAGNPANFSTMHAARVNDLTPCELSAVTFDHDGTNITVSTTAEFYGTIAGEYRLSLVMIEDDVISTAQTNYYNGGNNGLLTDPVTGFEWSTAGANVPAANFGGYDHVARTLSNNDILGDAGSLPSGTVTLGSHSYTFSPIPVTNFDDLTKVHPVVMIINSTTGEIMNAKVGSSISTLSIDELTQVAGYNVYPNPSAGKINLDFDLLNESTVSIEITDALGNIVHNEGSITMNAGTHAASFNGQNLASGMYFVNLNVNGKTVTKRLSIVK